MSQMFDKYDKKYKRIPDNSKFGPNNRTRFLDTNEYKDSIVIGADNLHTFALPYTLDELNYIWVTYKQGIEIKAIYKFNIVDFIPENDYKYVWKMNNQVWLYIFSEDEIKSQYEDCKTKDIIYCVLHYPISAEDSLNFNDYNKNVSVQLKACVNPNDNNQNDILEYSKIYKIKLIPSILEKEPLENRGDE